MKIGIAYVHPLDAGDQFSGNIQTWVQSYNMIEAGFKHRVFVSFTNGKPKSLDRDYYRYMSPKPTFIEGYDEGGWDIGAFQHVARNVDVDLMVFMNTRTRIKVRCWLQHFVAAAFEVGGTKSLLGASGSYERCPISPEVFPNPHIRTACFATNPHLFAQFPFRVDSRNDGFRFESGDWNFMEWYESRGWPVRVVCATNVLKKQSWRNYPNVFRHGDQSEVLVHDRHTEVFHFSNSETRKQLNETAGNPSMTV